MHRYRSFGLCIASEVRLDELRAEPDAARPVDITIRFNDLGYEIKGMGEEAPGFHYEDPKGVTMVWPGVGGYRIVDRHTIEIDRHPECSDNLLAFPLFGAVFAWLLHWRHLFVLHASAVHIGGKSVAFLGDKLAGKSTTAAAFLRAGGQLLTDDILAIETEGQDRPIIQPAFAQLKLSDEASSAIKLPGSVALPLVVPDAEKRQHWLDTMHEDAIACDALFVLKRGGDTPRIEWLDGPAALVNLMQFSYMVRFGLAPVEMQARDRHFLQCGFLAKTARVGVLHIPADLERLQETVEHVTSTLEASSP